MQQPDIDYWIGTMLHTYDHVSDLNVTAGKPLQVESAGIMERVEVQPEVNELTPFQAEIFALNILNGDRRLLNDLVNRGSCDLSYRLGLDVRFRVNVFSGRRNLSTVLRKLETTIPTIERLNLPETLHRICNEKNGMVLVTGATGTGKSTTLAAILDEVNQQKAIHVITLEDPIEYAHEHKKATFNQRELGSDFDTFSDGLRAALRQAPKVILVGEMRDRETMEIGLTAAETGHVVMSTLHTVDAGQTINRILGMFELEEQAQVRNRLADTVRWIVCQRLLPKIGGGRVAAIEILCMNLRIKELIMNGESEEKNFYDILTDGAPVGMMTFDQHILTLYSGGLITEDTALAYSSRRSVVARGLDQLKSARGESTTNIKGLAMEQGGKGPRSGY
ncbi:MAG: PilT/PilU family type 4a pilus ATPase [Proteobacteria bacterium]|nr:PilT/PilU family type 4a pilus ATPase [Pseudomonadota bacterium]MBU1686974.1 PilT/PilU family type 4a pilus ATPase [Pseudomonadota bacterium]